VHRRLRAGVDSKNQNRGRPRERKTILAGVGGKKGIYHDKWHRVDTTPALGIGLAQKNRSSEK